ncbi:hypothetical protein [Methylobacterium tarhaniae]|uniref:hypothetical protein n=1 Tax=Methylobacterium tarhaniae TaxID=1187852 RepID=UPI003D0375C2
MKAIAEISIRSKLIRSTVAGFLTMMNMAAAETINSQIGANRTLRITLKVGQDKPLSIEISGNGNSDLDFRVVDSNGKTVYEDLDDTDYTSFKLENPGVYNLYIINTQGVVNDCEIDIGEPDG